MTKQRGFLTGICLIIFILLTYLVSTGAEMAFDTVIREWFYSVRTPWLTEVVKGITFMGNTKTIIVLCLVFLVVPLVRGKSGLSISGRIGLPVAAAAIAGSGINKIMKHVMLRPRPDVSLHLIEQGGWSFPSGHSISSLLMYGLLAWLILHYAKGSNDAATDNLPNSAGSNRRMLTDAVAVILTVLWIGVGLSRIYLGVHYPTDVLGGWTLGMVVMMVTVTVVEKVENKCHQ